MTADSKVSLSILDLACGMGGDILKWFHIQKGKILITFSYIIRFFFIVFMVFLLLH
jgi:hypothetical protein